MAKSKVLFETIRVQLELLREALEDVSADSEISEFFEARGDFDTFLQMYKLEQSLSAIIEEHRGPKKGKKR